VGLRGFVHHGRLLFKLSGLFESGEGETKIAFDLGYLFGLLFLFELLKSFLYFALGVLARPDQNGVRLLGLFRPELILS